MPLPQHPLLTYATQVATTQATGLATPELSHYPALSNLLTAVGTEQHPWLSPLHALSDPSQRESGFPDFGMIETRSQALVAPIEVKGLDARVERVAKTPQVRRYAKDFGGGLVVVTNLWQWALVRLAEDGTLTEDASMRVDLAGSAEDFLAGNLNDADSTWRDLVYLIGYVGRVRGAITAPQRVATLLAYHAAKMRDAVNAAGDPDVLFASLKQALSDGLQIDLSGEHVAPTVVQTLVYGTFAAWLESDDPTKFEWMQSSFKASVPVFAEILHAALRPSLLRNCDLIPHLKNIEQVLRWTDRDRFATAFDGSAIQYFYEPFLAEFDPQLRRDLGIWYTPTEVAQYQVARVHHHLVNDLGIADGIADDSVVLLDPAVGTGTYLIAACDFVYRYHLENGEPPTIAADRARIAITTRFFGFELLPAAFVICHLHLSRHLAQLGAPLHDERIKVYLTNALTGWSEDAAHPNATLLPELEQELAGAGNAKQHARVLAVLGNPPYQGYSSAVTTEEREMMAEWSQATTETWNLRKHRMNDLYVRFWRMAIHRISTLTGQGVISFITNRQWLGGRSYPAMRDTLVNEFDTIWVDDLHGATNDQSVAGDQSVFSTKMSDGIQVGTAIVTAVRYPAPTPPATVRIAQYRGRSVTKRKKLIERHPAGMTSSDYAATPVSATSRYRFAPPPKDDFPSLSEYLPLMFSGVQHAREAVIADTSAALTARMRDYFDTTLNWAELIAKQPSFAIARPSYDPEKVRRKLLNGFEFNAGRIVRFAFKPMDERYLYWQTQSNLLHRSRDDLYPYWTSVTDQVSLVAAQTPRRIGGARPVPSRAVAGFEFVDPNARVFPLYGPDTLEDQDAVTDKLFETSQAAGAPTMVADEWVAAARTVLDSDDRSAGEAVFYAIVAITNSPKWLERQSVDSDDFCTVPLPGSAGDLREAVTLGQKLSDLFDVAVPVPGVTTGLIDPALRRIAVPTAATGTVSVDGTFGQRGGYYDGDDVVWSDQGRWTDVPPDVWSFTLGGFAVLPKWLSYRVRTGLDAQGRETFRMLCRRLAAIRGLEGESDALFDAALKSPLAI